MILKVIKDFRDKDKLSLIHREGESLSVNDLARINDLVRRGLCVIVSCDSPKSGKKADKKANADDKANGEQTAEADENMPETTESK